MFSKRWPILAALFMSISLIEQGVDKSADGRILLINPRKSVDYLLKM